MLFIAACAAASGICTILFTPHYETAVTTVSEQPRSINLKSARAAQVQNGPPAGPAEPSFDCTRVKSAVLKLICATPSLAKLDQHLEEAYVAAILASPSPREIIETERQWIKIRNNAEPNVFAIGVLYTYRIEQLRRIAGPAASSPGASASQNPSAAAPPNPMRFVYHNEPNLAAAMDMDFREVHADGEITPGTAARFAAFLQHNSVLPGASMVLNSPGGSVREAIELGLEIRDAGLSTFVQASKARVGPESHDDISGCFSSCTLAFLGGVERTVEPGAQFGVHQVSTTASLTPSEALQAGQAMIGTIAEYTAQMGAKAEFVFELTRATPDAINVLSQAQLSALNVTTPAFETEWQISSIDGKFFLVGTTKMNRGIDHLIVGCAPSGPQIEFMFNTTGHYMQDALDYTTDYGLEFDRTHMDLLATEIAEPIKKIGDHYVGVTIIPSARILDALQDTSSLTFEMMTPSHASYAGWTTDFASGRDQFNSFLKSCH